MKHEYMYIRVSVMFKVEIFFVSHLKTLRLDAKMAFQKFQAPGTTP